MYNAGSDFNAVAMSNIRSARVKVSVGTNDISGDVHKVDYAHEYPSFIGGFSAKSIEITVKAVAIDSYTLKTEKISVQMGFAGADLVPMGEYNNDPESLDVDEVTGFLKFICYDDALKFDIPFNAAGLEWPVTHDELVAYCCSKVGVPYEPSGALNNTVLIINDPWPEEVVSYRQVISAIAQANVAQAMISRFGKLEFRSVFAAQDDQVSFDGRHYVKLNAEMSQQQIDSVIIRDADGNGVIPAAMIGLTAHYPLTIKGNAILDSNPEAYIEDLYEKVDGFMFIPFEMELFTRPDLDSGDKITITNKDGTFFTTYAISLTATWQGGLRGKLSCNIPSETSAEYELSGLEQTVYNTIKKVKAANRELSSYVASSTQLFDSLSLLMGVYPTIETLADGSQIRYWHDQPALAASQIIWKQSAGALGYSTDGGLTWSGMDAINDTITAMVLSALEVRAERVILSGSTTLADKISDVDAEILNTPETITPEYYLSISSEQPLGGIWSEAVPEWVDGLWMFWRSKVTLKDGSFYYTPAMNATGATGETGKSSYEVDIVSLNGTTFKNGQISTTLHAHVYYGSQDVTSELDANRFRWTRSSDDAVSDASWNDRNASGQKSIGITADDVRHRATFFCEITAE